MKPDMTTSRATPVKAPPDGVIPVYHVTKADMLNGRPGCVTPLERHMDMEVGQVLGDWDDSVKSRKQSSFHIRPSSSASNSSSSTDRRRRRTSSGRTPNDSTGRFELPEVDVIRREESKFDTSTDSIDEETRRQYYVHCPDTGQRIFNMEIDIKGYDQQNISVKMMGSRLVVHATQQQTVDGRKSTTEFCRKIKLPSDVDSQKLQCLCKNDLLVVQAPLVVPSTATPSGGCHLMASNHNQGPLHSQRSFTSSPSMPALGASTARPEPLNVPTYRAAPSGGGSQLHLLVDIGRVFRADDVVVKVKQQNKVIVQADRDESESKSTLKASFTQEFELEENIIPESLKAGLTTDGILKLTAQVIKEAKVRVDVTMDTNGTNANNGTSGSEGSLEGLAVS